MRSPVILACLIGIQTCYHNAAGRNTEGYVQTSEMGWLEARKRCIEERNTDMFDPSETILLEQSDVVNNEFYWVGGFETSQWTWTDNSPLFTNIGLCGVPTDLDDEDVVDLPYNSVLECYRKCDKYRIGLNGSSCYCLDKIDQSACSKESRNITMCFGNPVDHCGTESRMSVYYVDIPFKMDADDGDNTCAYSKRPLFSSSDIGIHPYDCDKSLSSICVYEGKKKFDRCHNGLCVSTDTAPWTLSNQSCTLAKFSFSRRKDFIDLQSRWSYYWIGLHKTRLRHWIDGKTVQIDFENTDPVPRCLAMMKANDEWSEHWIPCNDEHQSICSSGGHSEPPIPCVSDTFHTTAETPSSTGEDNEIPRTTSQTREERQTVEENYAGKIGIYVGIIAGCLLLLAVISITVMCKRKGYFCFERQEDCKTIAMENVAYMCTDDLEVIDGSDHRGLGYQPTINTQSESTDNTFSREEGDYYNNTAALPKRTGDRVEHYDHLGADEENYDTAGVHRSDNVADNTYDHTDAQVVMVDNEQATYNHTGPQVGSNVMVDKEHDTNNHTGPRGGSNEMVDKEHDTYNHTGPQVGSIVMVDKEHDTYNHTEINHVVNVDKGQSRENVDHLRGSGSDKSTLDAGECYSHLVADADSDYDKTSPVMDDINGETYDHTTDDGDMKRDGSVDDSSVYYNL